MRKICVVTGTRAEYGILSGLLKVLNATVDVELQVIATNMHLSPSYGMTVNEIEADGLTVSCRIPLPLEDNSAKGTVRAMGVAMEGFSEAYESLQPDMILILGDRYEMLAAASAATIFGIPVVHFHGGEITEGAYDDAIRHAITKLSTYHFTATEEYRGRVIQMGEEPERVFNVGALGVDNILHEQFMTLSEFNRSLKDITEGEIPELKEGFLLVTFHPVTRQPEDAAMQTKALLRALDECKDRQVLFTMPNSDTGGKIVGDLIREWESANKDRAICVTSLGRKRYYSALKHCGAVVGNSSSGLIEAPSFGIPTVNIGDRQKGRAQGNTVINCAADEASIKKAITSAISPEFQHYCKSEGLNPYAGIDTLKSVKALLLSLPAVRHLPKHFHDILK
ncbi:MAG: UDP-N-acetylglucosamine 2-epimerase (hydrolyzing) [Muribaculaceae bacterium]|nr:UDP-N-acetylglucosamine 2-epimerase (hydrolyzing) [Muribaculaceae bacterium]